MFFINFHNVSQSDENYSNETEQLLEEQELFEDKTNPNFNENYEDEEQFEALLQQLGRLLDCLNCNFFDEKTYVCQKYVFNSYALIFKIRE